MAFKRMDIESLHDLVQRVVSELPEHLQPQPRDARMSASEYGHWSRRIPKYAMVNIGGQRAANPAS
jgi:small-conductance mechanosensitive channel